MQVYITIIERVRKVEMFFFLSVRCIFVDAMKTCSSKYSTEVGQFLRFTADCNTEEVGMWTIKFYDFLIDIEEEMEG